MALPTDRPAIQGAEPEGAAAVATRSGFQWRDLLTYLAPLEDRDFRLLVIGQVISTFGDMFYFIALPWIILTGPGGARDLGVALALFGAARIGSSALGGVLSDRIHPMRVMLMTDGARAVIIALFALAVFAGRLALWQLCLFLIPLGVFEGLFLPAYVSATPRLLARDKLQAGNAVGQTANLLAVVLGPVIGGLLVARLQPGVALLLDAGTFLLSAISLLLIQQHRLGARNEHAGAALSNAESATSASGATEAPALSFWEFIRTATLLQVALGLVALTNITADGTMNVALPAFAHNQLQAGATGYGCLLSIYGLGTLLGGIASAGLGGLPKRGIVATWVLLAQAGALALIPTFGGIVGAGFGLFIAGACTGVISILFLTLIQQAAPQQFLGRVMGVFMVVTTGLYPVSVAIAGFVTAHWNPAFMFVISGATLALAGIIGLLQPEIRKL